MSDSVKFENLEVWQEARRLVNQVYDLSDRGAFARDFPLRDQIRRASISVMSNIAEGAESKTIALFIDLLGRAKASAGEVRSQAYVALDRQYVTETEFQDLRRRAGKTSRQLFRLIQHLSRKPNTAFIREDLAEYLLAPPISDGETRTL